MTGERQIELTEAHAEEAVSREVMAIRAKVPNGIGKKFCDCGNQIPDARRLGGYSSCIECARASELAGNRFRKH
jgi:RNA polymerase-binding transcription factor DksA